MSSRRRLIILLATAAVALPLAAAGAWLVAHRDSVEASSVDDALRRFRERARSGETPIPSGVYRYRTSGLESVSALGGSTHRYPTASTLTVTPGPCGMELRWDVLRGRSTTWQVCQGEGGLQAGDWEDVHTFFGQRDVTGWRCNPVPWLPGPDAAGTATSRLCDDGTTRLAGDLQVLEPAAVAVAGTPVAAVLTRLVGTEDGSARGSFLEERWLERESGLPLRVRLRVVTLNSSPVGDVRFEERYELRLLSLEAVR